MRNVARKRNWYRRARSVRQCRDRLYPTSRAGRGGFAPPDPSSDQPGAIAGDNEGMAFMSALCTYDRPVCRLVFALNSFAGGKECPLLPPPALLAAHLPPLYHPHFPPPPH